MPYFIYLFFIGAILLIGFSLWGWQSQTIATFFILPKVHLSALIIALILGYIIPDLWLMRKISLRKQAITRFLPEGIDLLGLCIEADLDFTTAID